MADEVLQGAPLAGDEVATSSALYGVAERAAEARAPGESRAAHGPAPVAAAASAQRVLDGGGIWEGTVCTLLEEEEPRAAGGLGSAAAEASARRADSAAVVSARPARSQRQRLPTLAVREAQEEQAAHEARAAEGVRASLEKQAAQAAQVARAIVVAQELQAAREAKTAREAEAARVAQAAKAAVAARLAAVLAAGGGGYEPPGAARQQPASPAVARKVRHMLSALLLAMMRMAMMWP